jgi:hypothetical protein
MITEFNVVTKTEDKPIGIVIHGKGGLGKTTFGANAVLDTPKGLMIECGETALGELKDVKIAATPRFLKPDGNILGTGNNIDELAEEWIYFKEEFIKGLMLTKHGFTRLFFDNFDNMINNNLSSFVIKNYYKNDLVKANAYGGQKLREMDAELALIIKAFEYLQKKGIEIFISTHSQIVNFKDPAGDDYKKWAVNLPAMEGANLRERLIYWSSITAFATYDVDVSKKKVDEYKRVLKTQIHPSWDAKCRYNIPDSIDFSYDTFRSEVEKAKKTVV